MAKQSTLKNMVLVLTLIALAGSAILGVVNSLTAEPIRQVGVKKVNAAIEKVVPAFDNNPYAEVQKVAVDGDTVLIYPAMKNGELVGKAIETFTKQGYGGDIRLMVGFLPNGDIYKIAVVKHGETPGLGDKIDPKKGDFSLQFEGKNPAEFKLKVKKDKGDVDAITASTISSRAFCEAVTRAYEVFKQQAAPSAEKEVRNE